MRSASVQRACSSIMLRSVFGKNVVFGNGNPAAVAVAVPAMAPAVTLAQDKAIGKECPDVSPP